VLFLASKVFQLLLIVKLPPLVVVTSNVVKGRQRYIDNQNIRYKVATPWAVYVNVMIH